MPNCIELNIYLDACDEKPRFTDAIEAIKEVSARYNTFPQKGDFLVDDEETLCIVKSRQWHEESLTIWVERA